MNPHFKDHIFNYH